MSRQFPLWVEINSCAYKSGKKSYGIKQDGETKVYAGTSSANSNLFYKIRTTKVDIDDDGLKYRKFTMSVDDLVLKIAYMNLKTNEYKVVFNRMNVVAIMNETIQEWKKNNSNK